MDTMGGVIELPFDTFQQTLAQRENLLSADLLPGFGQSPAVYGNVPPTPAVSQSWLDTLTSDALKGALTVSSLATSIKNIWTGKPAATPTATVAQAPMNILGLNPVWILVLAIVGVVVVGSSHFLRK